MNAAISGKDFDEEDVELIKQVGEKWDQYKQKLYMKSIIERYNKRHIDDYKCY